jgi:hypothetical protein
MPTLPRSLHQRHKPKAIGWEARAAMNTALSRSLAHENAGHREKAQHFAEQLVRLLRDHGLLGDA